MNKHTKNQKGFGAVEMLLLVLIVLVAAFAGYYVAHNHNQTKPVASTSVQKYVTIKEWDARAPYNGSLTLEYGVLKNGVNIASFSSSQLDNAGCKYDLTKYTGGGGDIVRFDSASQYMGTTAASYASTLSSTKYGHIGNYYFFYVSPGGPCSSSSSAQATQDQTQIAVEGLLPKLQAIPN